jgi:hypothetical protein
VSQRVDVTNAESFRTALATLNGSTHGDTLAIYLALKKHQDELPTIGDGREGLVSGELEKLLDLFYTKRDGRLGRDSGRVCKIFSGNFTQAASHGQNNWRDFFRYGLGVGVLGTRGTVLDRIPRSTSQRLSVPDAEQRGCACLQSPSATDTLHSHPGASEVLEMDLHRKGPWHI